MDWSDWTYGYVAALRHSDLMASFVIGTDKLAAFAASASALSAFLSWRLSRSERTDGILRRRGEAIDNLILQTEEQLKIQLIISDILNPKIDPNAVGGRAFPRGEVLTSIENLRDENAKILKLMADASKYLHEKRYTIKNIIFSDKALTYSKGFKLKFQREAKRLHLNA